MKALKISSLAVAVMLFVAACGGKKETVETGDAQDVQASTGTELSVDNGASSVMWKGYKGLGSGIAYSHVGTVDVAEGMVTVKDGALEGGKITIDLKTIQVTDEGMPEEKKAGLAGHLLTSDFFGVYTLEGEAITDTVEANAIATFEITSIADYTAPAEPSEEEWATANPTHNVTGNLTIKGITKSITFPAHVEVSEGTVKAAAKFFIDRQKWNVSFMSGDSGMIEAGKDQYIMDEMGIGFDITAKAPMASAAE